MSHDKRLEVFWHNVDPTDDGGRFCDRGENYKTAVFYRFGCGRDNRLGEIWGKDALRGIEKK